ncbi:DUF6538 domain-containing protein [Aliiroseovarius sediminis]|uniref:DUF6538 domain-containing protein n=1 Tax=Aliiroseovarius sediminis TaxID=2925839 RepID=UPI001F571E96|nr:DUF6538 domain-containing protein [Aliiroseovarius sediminis]MCI2395087.1 hypothetical protein [Aliiroseovarius sediminis]
MVLQMPRPYKRKSSGIYYFRQKVPADLRGKLGDTSVSCSLRTRDPEEAKVRNAEKVREQAMIWEAHRKKPSPLPMQKIAALCGVFYRDYMTMLEVEPGEAEVWHEIQRLNAQLDASVGNAPCKLSKWYAPTVDELLLQHTLVVDEQSRERLLTQIHQTMRLASEQQLKHAQGDYSPDPNLDRFPDASVLLQDAEQAPIARPAPKSLSEQNDAESVSIWKPFKLWEKDHLADGKSLTTVGDYKGQLVF